MNLSDVNVWLAISISTHAHHRAAREWLDDVEQPASIYFCRATQTAYLRLLTNPAVLEPYGNPPLTNEEAWDAYQALLADDRIEFEEREPAELESMWKRFALRDTASSKLWMDAYLASFAVAGGLTMVTTDSAFRQFEDLDLVLLS